MRGSPGPPGSGARRSPPCLSLSQIGAPKLSLSCLQTPARAAIRLRAFRLLVFHFSLPPSFSNRNPCLRGRKARADSGRRRRLRWRWGGGGSAATCSRGSSPGHVSAADGDSTLTRDRESIRGEMAPLGSLRLQQGGPHAGAPGTWRGGHTDASPSPEEVEGAGQPGTQPRIREDT